jgi:NAD-dependent dihydropyrimidine dehydrogenase PreA subunit
MNYRARRAKPPIDTSCRREYIYSGKLLVPEELTDIMAYIICEPCVGTKDTACVDVCPVDCIHPRKDEAEFPAAEMLYIHPDECIDCGACVPACPVDAIFSLDETPHKWEIYIAKNRNYFA